MNVRGVPTRTVWLDNGTVKMINQPLLPHHFEIVTLHTYQDTANAIQTMIVRGAGAIGATAAAGMAQAIMHIAANHGDWDEVHEAARILRATRPTAQNLFYAIDTVLDAAMQGHDSLEDAAARAKQAAVELAEEDVRCCQAMGKHGAPLIEEKMGVATHCNAGWLAFVDWGSALAPMYTAHREGKNFHVYAGETRPRSQGARLTAWELGQEGIPHTVVVDSAMASLLKSGRIHRVFVGADRIAANGDVANKIGTYPLAVLAREHGVPFYVVAPTTTVDINCPDGANIPIEERGEEEVACTWGMTEAGVFTKVRTAAPKAAFYNPAFDVTPAKWITAIITEEGIIPPDQIGSCARFSGVR
jgi:methylthioribose-1-phosphate isomerase